MKNFIKNKRRRYGIAVKILFLLGFAFFASLVFAGVITIATLRNIPTADELFSRRVVESTKIYDRTGGVLLYEIHGEEKRTVIPFNEMPAAVKNAAVAIEDANFYNHPGVDARGIMRALVTDIVFRNIRQGGSTITQQLVKNSLLGRERTIKRKIKEAVLAVALETKLPKEEILNLYLNQIPYGSNSYGIEAAAQTFFGKHAKDLTLPESALLAALPAAPSYYSPYGQHKDELLGRKNKVIDRMLNLGYVDAEEAERAKNESFKFLPAAKNIRAPHFVMFVRDYLLERYGEDEVSQGGLIVTTTLDWKLQEEAEKIVAQGAERNERLIKARNMALAAINPKNGEVLAMVGSRDYFDIENDGNFNVATALRQPGSSFKPFVYATAFKKGYTPDTVLFDVPTEFNPQCTPEGEARPETGARREDCYHPQNYDEKFRGPVTLRQAIAQSLNVPSVKVLYLAGIEDSIRTAEDLGISSLKARERFGLSLVLGGAEVSLYEMTSAFGVFANEGILNPPTAILKVSASDGRILEEKKENPRPVLDPEIARTINDVLSDNDARTPVFQPQSSLYFKDRKVAAKTGTTQKYRDAWTIGYTPALAVGVWAGNNDNSPMRQKGSGVMAAAPSWHAFMEFSLAQFENEEFPIPEKLEAEKPILKGLWQGDTVVTVDTISKKRATDLTPPETKQDVAYGQPHDPLYWIDRDNPTGPPPENARSDPQYKNWEAAFLAWLGSSGFTPKNIAAAPTDFDDIHTAGKKPRINVQQKTEADGTLVIKVSVEAYYGLKEASLLYDGRIIMSKTRPSSLVEFSLSKDDLSDIFGSMEIRVYDDMGNIGSDTIIVH